MKKISVVSKSIIALTISVSLFFCLNKAKAEHSNHIRQDVGKGTIDWTDKTISVTGSGAMPDGKSGAQGRLLAERAAIADAYRQLAEIIHGVRVDSETIVKDFVTESDLIKTNVEGFIKGARRGEKRITTDGAVEYDLSVSMYGNSGLADAIDLDKHIIKKNNKVGFIRNYHSMWAMLPGVVTDQTFFTVSNRPQIDMNNCLQCHTAHKIPDKLKETKEDSAQPPAKPVDPDNITGVIIDAKGLGLTPAMDPAIFDKDLKQVYIGQWEIDPDYVINYGIIGYFSELEDAKKDSRVGSNPIIIKANSIKNVTDLILEAEATNTLQQTESKSKFLEKYAVNVVL